MLHFPEVERKQHAGSLMGQGRILVSSANHYLLTLGSPGRDRVLQSAPSPLGSPGSIPEGTRLKCDENSQNNQSKKRRGSTNGQDSGNQQPRFLHTCLKAKLVTHLFCPYNRYLSSLKLVIISTIWFFCFCCCFRNK